MSGFNLVRHLPLCMLLLWSQPGMTVEQGNDAIRQELQQLREEMQRQRQHYEQRIQALEKRLNGEQKVAKPAAATTVTETTQTAMPSPAPTPAPAPSPAPASAPGPVASKDERSSKKFEVGLTSLVSVGGSSVDNDALANLQGGAHDPNKSGFTVQNIELSLSGSVDPYVDGQAYLIMQIDAEGETVVELEEAFFTTRSLPWGLQLKGGQFFTEFGRQNAQHPHSWAFVDQPVVLTRFFGGDGLRSQGARVSWLMPTDWYSEVIVGAQNAKGETVTSFLGEAGEDIGGYTLLDRSGRNADDLLYNIRWLNGFDVSDTVSINVGVSGLWGPNASGTTTDTRIVGADLYLKWQPETSQRGYPFMAWHTEVLKRRYEAGDPSDPGSDILHDEGLFTQLQWGFKPGWVAGLRWEYASAEGDTASDPMRDTRKRLSPNLTWYPTEYSKVRIQYNRDWTQHLPEGTADSFWLQFEYSLGSHSAHIF